MESLGKSWYKQIWSLDIMEQSWVEDTEQQVSFLIDVLHLHGNERILDLACGFGRHSIELAKRGFSVVGVDITKDYVEYANRTAANANLNAAFILSDIRELDFIGEFDVVINMGDGAIGYLENEEENLKVFDVISNALKTGGKHFMDIMNAAYADRHFPCRLWDAGEKSLTLSKFEWNKDTRIMMYGQLAFRYGDILNKPTIEKGNPTRLYSLQEIKTILQERGLVVRDSFADWAGGKPSPDFIQLLVCSERI